MTADGLRGGGAVLVQAGGVPAGWGTARVDPGPLLETVAANVRAARRIARAT